MRRRTVLSGIAASAVVVALVGPAGAATATATVIGTDPFTQATCQANSTTNHDTEVEPDTFSYGKTIVAAFQVGRVFNGGGCAIGFATSTNNGASWKSGLLPGITKWTSAQGTAPGADDRVTDSSVAYDAKHGVWLVSSVTLLEAGGLHADAVITSRSVDGLTWSNPVATSTGGNPDKNWTVCDNTATSPYFGRCYTQWDDHSHGNRLQMSTSTDGGLTWSAAATNNTGVIGGQPVVRPDGTVIVPISNANQTAIGAFDSTDGGASWSPVTTISKIRHHTVAGSLRESPLPSAGIDGAGTVYVTWSDCQFRASCTVNDLVLSRSLDATGTSWSSVTRIPIDGTDSGIDHFIPGLGVNNATSGGQADLGLTYYFYPVGSTALSVGFISSTDAGSTWSAPQTIASGIPSTWVASTSQGRMVGDYISTSFDSNGLAHGVFATASAPTSGPECSTSAADNCAEPTSTFTSSLPAGTVATANDPVLFAGSGGTTASSLWNVVDNNGSQHRD